MVTGNYISTPGALGGIYQTGAITTASGSNIRFISNNNIQQYGNTTAATIPLCLWEYESQLKKGDNLILAAFGGGFTWGAIYLKWALDPK